MNPTRRAPRGSGSASWPGPKVLHAPRLRLEPLEESHATALFDGLRNDALYEFIAEGPPASVTALRERYRRLASRLSPDGRQFWLNWALWSLPEERYLGYVQATVRHDRSADIAYVLFREAWGHGYGREAVTALIEHLQSDWRTPFVRASVDTRNQRSIAMLESLGFQPGEVRIEAERIHGILADEVEYRLASAAGPSR